MGRITIGLADRAGKRECAHSLSNADSGAGARKRLRLRASSASHSQAAVHRRRTPVRRRRKYPPPRSSVSGSPTGTNSPAGSRRSTACRYGRARQATSSRCCSAKASRSRKDDVLFIIDPRPYQADYDRARAGLALARSQHELAEAGSGARAEAQGFRRRVARGDRRAPEPAQSAGSERHGGQGDARYGRADALLHEGARAGRRARQPGRSHARQSRDRRQRRRHAAHDDRFHRPDLRLFRGR